MKAVITLIVFALLAGCANREIKVSCDGKLVAINHAEPQEAR